LGESITTARRGLKILSTHSSGPSEIKLWGFLYSEWGVFTSGKINREAEVKELLGISITFRPGELR
jgi:hypothetical protein